MLLYSIFFVLVGSLFTCLFLNKDKTVKSASLFFSNVVFLLSLGLWLCFDNRAVSFQYPLYFSWSPLFNQDIFLGVDSLSLFFVILTAMLIPFCLLASWSSVEKNAKLYCMLFLLLDLLLILVFCFSDLLLFYFSFEAVLVPMYLIIGIWGSRDRKVRAGYLFFFFTLISSIFMLLGIIYIYLKTGSTSYEVISSYSFSPMEQRWLWLSFFVSLASKMPMFPFHIWLPEAHVEAPTAGSVLLAGVLLKLGSYGFLRFPLSLFPDACVFYAPLVFVFGSLGIVYASLTAIRQTDFKRIIAYSSVAHMNLVMLSLFSFSVIGFEGAVLQSLSHGFVASGLFLLIGVLYDRAHTRDLYYFSGLAQVMPLMSIIFLIFTMANIALPGTSSFVGEFLMLAGIFNFSTFAAFMGATGMVLGGAYSLWLYNRVCYGNLKIEFIHGFVDLNLREFCTLFPLLALVLIVGFFPNVLLEPIAMYNNYLGTLYLF